MSMFAKPAGSGESGVRAVSADTDVEAPITDDVRPSTGALGARRPSANDTRHDTVNANVLIYELLANRLEA